MKQGWGQGEIFTVGAGERSFASRAPETVMAILHGKISSCPHSEGIVGCPVHRWLGKSFIQNL